MQLMKLCVQAELSLLGQLSHPNIASLLGYCNHGDENLLVYEYIENRRLDILLFTSNLYQTYSKLLLDYLYTKVKLLQ